MSSAARRCAWCDAPAEVEAQATRRSPPLRRLHFRLGCGCSRRSKPISFNLAGRSRRRPLHLVSGKIRLIRSTVGKAADQVPFDPLLGKLHQLGSTHFCFVPESSDFLLSPHRNIGGEITAMRPLISMAHHKRDLVKVFQSLQEIVCRQ